ncbi:GTP-binding protein [Dehalobacter restrictus]|uniref:GTP-binding protein n=1 Tax=Dehalobacter sp. TBBPA1 TaxID=3235037 RepID=UPI00031D948D
MFTRIVFVSGFLGSGKTTFIVKLVESLAQRNIKAALIVNEAGEIGIDNQYMKQLGYNVWEIFGGCICCTLSVSLEHTIQELEKNYHPDVIIIEPSGAANPETVYNSLISLGIEKERIANFFILDPTRIEMFLEILTPLLISSLELADCVLINKIDLADGESIEKCRELALTHGPHSPNFLIDASQSLSGELSGYIANLIVKR